MPKNAAQPPKKTQPNKQPSKNTKNPNTKKASSTNSRRS